MWCRVVDKLWLGLGFGVVELFVFVFWLSVCSSLVWLLP